MSGPSRLQLPVRKPTYRFALTPLADAMFQLLAFFMLTSSLTPYSLLTLQTAPAAAPGADAVAGTETTTQADTDAPPAEVALWTVERDGLVIGGQTFAFDALPALAGALGTQSALADVVLIIRAEAQVQDIATILEALQSANVASVRISTGAG